MDTSAVKSASVKGQEITYCKAEARSYSLRPSARSCEFCDVVPRSQAILEIRVSTYNPGFISTKVDVIDADVL